MKRCSNCKKVYDDSWKICLTCKNKLRFVGTPEEIKECEETLREEAMLSRAETEKEMREFKENTIVLAQFFLYVPVYLLIIPSLIVLAVNICFLVVFGDMHLSDLTNNFGHYSFRPVLNFYSNLYKWGSNVYFRLTH